MQIGVITNPNSRKNRGRPQRREQLQRAVGDLGEVHQTPNTEALKPVLREFLRKRARYWVSDGGDGSLHHMLRAGLEVLDEEEFASEERTLPVAVPTNGGSIDFVAKNVGIKGYAEDILAEMARALERGQTLEEVEVDTLQVEGVARGADGDEPIRALGFASAAGGVAQRFFEKLFEAGSHTTKTIVEVTAKTVASYPVAMTPLRHLPGMPRLLRSYAGEMFKPTLARVTVDGEVLPRVDCRAINVASMSIDLGGVFRFFGQAAKAGQLHAIVGAPPPITVIANLPLMVLGRKLTAPNTYDGGCSQLTMEAVGEELLAPVIDGELYPDVRHMTFSVGPRVRIPKVVARRPSVA